MSDEGSGLDGSNNTTDVQDIIAAIEKARTGALVGKHRFLIYLLDMAWLEATNLSGPKAR